MTTSQNLITPQSNTKDALNVARRLVQSWQLYHAHQHHLSVHLYLPMYGLRFPLGITCQVWVSDQALGLE